VALGGRGEEVKRGDLVAVVLPGRYGKPRPGLVVQHDAFEGLPSVTLLPLTSDLRDLPLLRIPVQPGGDTGLRVRSEVQVDKVMTVPKDKIGPRIGTLDRETQLRVDEALSRYLGLAGSASPTL
jgi:mRNA interferase MazF